MGCRQAHRSESHIQMLYITHAWYTMHIVLTRMHAHHRHHFSVPTWTLGVGESNVINGNVTVRSIPTHPFKHHLQRSQGKTTEITPARTKSILPLKQAERNCNERQTTLMAQMYLILHKSWVGNNKRRTVQFKMYALRKAHICCIQELLQRQHCRDFWEVGCLSHRSSSNAAFEAAPVFAWLAIVLRRWITKYSFLHLSLPDEQWC